MDFIIGVDGGGTKTEAAAFGMDGQLLGRVQGGASNPHAVSYEQAIPNLTAVLDALLAQPGLSPSRCKAVCLGLAGVDSDEERTPFQLALANYAREKKAAPFSC